MYYEKPSLIQALRHSEFARKLSFLLSADIALSILYSLVPPQYEAVRSTLAFIQLGFMTVTMWITIRRVLEDY